MIVTAVKSSAIERGPRIIIYRDCSSFDPSKFKEDLRKEFVTNSSFCENLKLSTL